MRLVALALLLLASIALLPTTSGRHDGGDLINAVLGNPTTSFSSETARIRAHLQAVAERLAATDDSAFEPALREARRRNLDRLRAYARAGAFPSKPAHIPGRIPNFVDEAGNVCAVGYLIERDLGRDVVAEIARGHQFDYVPYIDSPVLAEWQTTSGLSKLELAMIQPEYGQPQEPFMVPSDGGWSNHELFVASVVASNLAISIVNFSYLADGRGSVVGGWLGVVSGAASFIYGLSEDNATFSAAGVMAGSIGLVSFGLGAANAHDENAPVTVGATVKRDDDGGVALGVAAALRF